jgi:hypothetical protein
VSLGAAEGRRKEGLCVIPGDLDAHDPPAQAEDVHVVVFDPPGGRNNDDPGMTAASQARRKGSRDGIERIAGSCANMRGRIGVNHHRNRGGYIGRPRVLRKK